MKNLLLYLLNIIKNLLISIRSIENNITRLMNQLQNKPINITHILDRDDLRCKIFYLSNNSLLDGKPLLEALYHTLLNNEIFKEFGYHKVIIISGINNGIEYNFHHNILINNLTTFEEYFNKVKDIIEVRYEDGYETDIHTDFKIMVWNMDDLVNKNIKITRKATKISNKREYHSKARSVKAISPIPLSRQDLVNNSFATIDLETMTFDNKEVCVLITFYSESTGSKIFVINHALFKSDLNQAILNLWEELFNFLNTFENLIVFAHNLGSFDGYFIFKQLSMFAKPEEVNTIIDKQNKFIVISYKNKIVFKDSFRIFPVSLNEFCKIFNVKGKSQAYNDKFNNFNLFDNEILFNEFISYARQDSKCLYQSILKAQDIYIKKYNVDITSIFSTSTLSLKIFRSRYLEVDIPILSKSEDNYIRKSYLGGATDYYKAYGKLVRNYDVTSLYPFSMCKPMPYKLIKYHKDLSNYDLNNFFGFIKAEIIVDKNVIRPMLPFKYNGKTIFPTGTFTSTYFSEELKAVVNLEGYKIRLISGYEFSKIELFNKYIDEFFAQKKYSVGAERFIAKMHLNQLYGYFGRSMELMETMNVYKKNIRNVVIEKNIKSIIEINDNIFTLLIETNLENKLINNLNSMLNTEYKSYSKHVKCNVALASAITSYSRIHMIPFKLNPAVLYSDTDSIYTTEELDSDLVGIDLGLMKDELNGNVINEAYFLGIKQYGYWYYDKSHHRKDISVFAGVKRNTLSFDQIKSIHKGEVITLKQDNRFFKSMNNLSIKIQSVNTNIQRNNDKLLVNNIYLPIHITNHKKSNNLLFYLRRINKILKKVLNIFKIPLL